MRFFKAAVLATLFAAFAACGGDDDGDSEIPAECEEIAELCHESTTEAGIECHENAEGVWSAEECTENEAACLAECEEE
jgi:hypothetical protein